MLLIDILMAAGPCLFAISRIHVVQEFIARTHRRKIDWSTLSTWLFSLFFGIGMAFRIAPFRAMFEAWVGVNNIGWFLSFFFASVALYLAAWGTRSILQVPAPRWLQLSRMRGKKSGAM